MRQRSHRPSFLSFHGAAVLLGLAIAAPTGCSNSGLDANNKKGETEVVDGGTEPEPIENCPDLCADAYDTYAPLGCDVSCDINLGTTVEASFDVLVVTLAAATWFDVELGVETGETCDVVVECPEVTECLSLAMLCLSDSDNAADYCISEYLECDQETMCSDEYANCYDNAWIAYGDCTGTYAQCWTLYDNLAVACSEQYDACLGAGDEPAPPPPLPTTTAAGRINVPMGFIQHHLQRLATLDMETFTMVMPADGTNPGGLALHSIRPGDTLDQLGLEEGDVIVRINNNSIFTFSDAPATLLGFLANDGVEVTIRRGGVRRDLRYRFVD